MAKEIFQLIEFDKSTNSFFTHVQSPDFIVCVQEALCKINHEVDAWNVVITRAKSARKMDYLEYDEAFETFENGQNWCINNKVFGIIDVASETKNLDYEDMVLVVWDTELDDDDIKAMKIPFDDRKFFEEYMKRGVTILGGRYQVYTLDDFDSIINGDKLDIGFEDRPYIIHTKIVREC